MKRFLRVSMKLRAASCDPANGSTFADPTQLGANPTSLLVRDSLLQGFLDRRARPSHHGVKTSGGTPGVAGAEGPPRRGVRAYVFLLLQGGTVGADRTSANVVALEFAVQRGPANAEHFAGEDLIAIYLTEDPFDGGALDVFKIRGGLRRNEVRRRIFRCGQRGRDGWR